MSRTKPRAAIYARISDARDGDTAGVDRQVQDCQKHCQRQGYAVVDVFIDNNASAWKPGGKRPSFDRMMQAVDSGAIDVVVVYSADRLYRRLTDLESLVDRLKVHGTTVNALQSGTVDLSTADGVMHAGVLAVVAKHESEKRGERVARAARQRAEQGRFTGGTRRFGYNANCTELVPEEADALRWAYETVAAGGSVRSVWREWKNRGLKGPSGGSLPSGQVTTILKRPMNAGLRSYKGEVLPGKSEAPAVIDVATWKKVQAILSDPARVTAKRGRPSKALMAGHMRCGVCGEKVYRHYRGLDRATRAAYACAESKCTTRSGVVVDTFVTEVLGAWLAKNADKISRPRTKARATTSDPQRQAEQLRGKLDDLALLLAAGDLAAADYARATKEVRARLTVLEEKITAEVGLTAVRHLAQNDDVLQAWRDLDTEGKRAVIGELLASGAIQRIVLEKAKPGSTDPGVTFVWGTK